MAAIIDHSKAINRIIDILKANSVLSEKIREFRFGDAGDTAEKSVVGRMYPLCYVTTAANPEVSRETITAGGLDTLPGQKVTLEYWVVLVANASSPPAVQEEIYGLSGLAHDALASNIRLTDPNDGTDPLCATCGVMTQRRFETHRGRLVEAMTVRVRPVIYVRK